jgi:hypothetical protein
MIWKERNVAKYQKKNITKLKIINLIKSEISFIFSLAKSKTGNNIYTEMTNMFMYDTTSGCDRKNKDFCQVGNVNKK